MKIRMSIVAVVICGLAVMSIAAQRLVLKGETAYLGDQAVFTLKPVPGMAGGHTYLMNLKGKTLAYIVAYGSGTNMNNMYGKGGNLFHVSFPPTDQGAYMGIDGDLAELLDILHTNKAVKGGAVSKTGVSSLSKHGYVVMDNIGYQDPTKSGQPGEKVSKKNRKEESAEEFRKRMGFSDPSAPSRPREAASQKSEGSRSSTVSFSIKNECRNNVRIFIGTKPKYGSGTTSTLSGNSVNSRSASEGEQLCIVDDRENPLSCIRISSGMGRVSINSSGTGFGR